MSAPAEHEPTRIRQLHVQGYRSLRDLSLVDLPSIVVLHGENGTGKSNILRAMALPLRWLGSDLRIAATREASDRLDYVAADALLGIRRDDFHRAAQHEMTFRMQVELGSRARQVVDGLPRGAMLDVEVVVQDVGDGIRWWAPKAQIGEGLSLTSFEAGEAINLRLELGRERAAFDRVHANVRDLQEQLRDPALSAAQRTQATARLSQDAELGKQLLGTIIGLQRSLAGSSLTLDRLRSTLLRRELLRVSEAYRRIAREPIHGDSEFDVHPGALTAPEQIQRRLYLLATSSEARDRAVPQRLATHLAQVMRGAGEGTEPFQLHAVRNNEFREHETQLARGDAEGIPLTSLGTGEQQLLILLLDVLASATPIVQIEEPEAHLHKTLMLRLAELLVRIVDEHEVDQLFLATHHRAFAIALTYYDVTHDGEHGTRAMLTNRARAIEHFYEPGPLWDALRSLVDSGLREDAVLFRDESGAPVRASAVLASIQEEGPLAKRFAEEMTKTILLSMREDAEHGEA